MKGNYNVGDIVRFYPDLKCVRKGIEATITDIAVINEKIVFTITDNITNQKYNLTKEELDSLAYICNDNPFNDENEFTVGTEVVVVYGNTMFKGSVGIVLNTVQKGEDLYCLIKFSGAFPRCWIKSTNLITQEEFIKD